jgi:hypothetical protein
MNDLSIISGGDLEKIEQYVIAPTYNDLDPSLLVEVMQCLG